MEKTILEIKLAIEKTENKLAEYKNELMLVRDEIADDEESRKEILHHKKEVFMICIEEKQNLLSELTEDLKIKEGYKAKKDMFFDMKETLEILYNSSVRFERHAIHSRYQQMLLLAEEIEILNFEE